MSRKNTILIAVIINIGLIAVLFFTASKQKENSLPIDPSGFLVEKEMPETMAFHEDEPHIETYDEAQIVHVLPEVIEEKDSSVNAEKKPVVKKNQEKLKEITIKKGDSLDKIAKSYHVSIDDIVEVNNLKTTIIRIGQVLKIPNKVKSTQNKAKNPIVTGEYYTVKPGDNPWTIAMKYNIKVEDLLKMNNLNKDKAKKLRPGDKLRIK